MTVTISLRRWIVFHKLEVATHGGTVRGYLWVAALCLSVCPLHLFHPLAFLRLFSRRTRFLYALWRTVEVLLHTSCQNPLGLEWNWPSPFNPNTSASSRPVRTSENDMPAGKMDYDSDTLKTNERYIAEQSSWCVCSSVQLHCKLRWGHERARSHTGHIRQVIHFDCIFGYFPFSYKSGIILLQIHKCNCIGLLMLHFLSC
jgi:hypothetical protein